MASVNKDYFREAQPSQLAIFELPPTQTAVENIYYQDVLPISQIAGDSPIEFVVSGQNGMEYIDMKNTLLSVKVKVKKSDGTDIDDDEDVGPVNMFLQALFNQVEVSLQGKTVVSTTDHYAYKAYLQTLLKYGYDAKSSQLRTMLWMKDTDGEMSDVDVATGSNLSLLRRAQYIQGGRTCDMQGPLFHDLFKMDRYLLNQVNVNVKLYRSKPEFCLVSNAPNPNYSVVFEEIVLRVAKVKINPAVIYAQAQVLANNVNAKYPFTQTIVKQITVPGGGTSFTYDNIFQGMRPNFITVGFVKATATTGAYDQNPWYFQNYNVNRIGLFIDGISVNGNPLKIDYTKNKETVVPVLTNTFTTTGRWLNDSGNDISRDDIAKGYALYTFNLEPVFQDSDYLTLLKQGNVRLEVTFSRVLTEAVSCVIYAEYPGYFEINAARDVVQS